MNSIFALTYASILFGSLILISLYLARQLKMTQKIEKKLALLEKKLQINEQSSDCYYKLGQLYLRKKIYEKAIILFRKALKHWDKNDKIGLGSLYNTLGFTYFNLKQYEHSIYYYTEAIKLLPDYTLALTNLGLAYENRVMYKEAYNTYLKVLKYEKSNKIANFRLEQLKLKVQLVI